MRSALRYFPVIQNKNPVTELAAGKPVGNVNRSFTLDDLIKALIALSFCRLDHTLDLVRTVKDIQIGR